MKKGNKGGGEGGEGDIIKKWGTSFDKIASGALVSLMQVLRLSTVISSRTAMQAIPFFSKRLKMPLNCFLWILFLPFPC